MFKAELKSETFKSIVYIASTLVDEMKFSVHSDGMTMKAIDAARVAMIEITVDKEAFINYEADESDIGLDLDRLKTALKLAGPGDNISLDYDVDQGRLTMVIGHLVRRMSVVDPTNLPDPKVPAVELDTKIKLGIEQFQKGIHAAESIDVDNAISLSADEEGFEISSEGDNDYVSLKIPAAELSEFVTAGSVKSVYPLLYFLGIAKVIPAGTVLDLQLKTDYPIKISFDFAEGHAHVTYLLAPRIEHE